MSDAPCCVEVEDDSFRHSSVRRRRLLRDGRRAMATVDQTQRHVRTAGAHDRLVPPVRVRLLRHGRGRVPRGHERAPAWPERGPVVAARTRGTALAIRGPTSRMPGVVAWSTPLRSWVSRAGRTPRGGRGRRSISAPQRLQNQKRPRWCAVTQDRQGTANPSGRGTSLRKGVLPLSSHASDTGVCPSHACFLSHPSLGVAPPS